MKRGLLLFAHGARDSRWALPFDAIVERVRGLAPQVPVQLGFLEFMTPSLVDAGRRLAAAGCDRIDVVPLFLGAGGHVKQDIPKLVAAANPPVPVTVDPPIGEQAALIDAIAAGIASPR